MALLPSPMLQHSRLIMVRSSPPNSADRDSSGSYLGMWKRAKERQEQEQLRLFRAAENEKELTMIEEPITTLYQNADWDVRARDFASILQVPSEERDKVQTMQVVDRAAAALAAVNAFLNEESTFRNTSATLPPSYAQSKGRASSGLIEESKPKNTSTVLPTLGTQATPGPDFWTWSPTMQTITTTVASEILESKVRDAVLEKDVSMEIPFECTETEFLVFQSRAKPSLPPLQSLREIKEDKAVKASEQVDALFTSVSIPDIAEEITSFMCQDTKSTNMDCGVNQDGSRWWKEMGEELREDGVTCSWTVIRGINLDGTEWEEKFWEAFDEFDYKELGAEKSGRDATGNVWREFWKEAMWQDLQSGLLHIEKNADKWGKNGYGTEWHEKWWEHYDALGRAEKSAEKWCKIDERTPLEPGHAHIWHERWGEKFDGQGGAMKYSDKWAERSHIGGWSKWGDKWDENFDKYSHGKKQGETWWEGPNGEKWNRTWGEDHNATGWVHKYGKSSSGEHWDTHEQQETWYERHPHYGFHHCLENSGELQKVGNRSQ